MPQVGGRLGRAIRNTMSHMRFTRGDVLCVVGWAWLVACFSFLLFFISENVLTYIDSDVSAALILSELLSQTGGLVTTEWCYSTGVLFLDVQAVFTPLFFFFDSWRDIRLVGTAICLIVFLAAFFAFCSSVKARRLFPWLASVLMLPFSYTHAEYFLLLPQYTLSLSLELTVLAVMLRCLDSDSLGRVRFIVYVCIGAVASLVCGLSSMRATLLVIVPLAFACLVLVKLFRFPVVRRSAICLCALVVANVVGCLLFSFVVSDIFSVRTFSDVRWSAVSFENLGATLTNLLAVLGYAPETGLLSKYAVPNLLSIAVVGLLALALCDELNPRRAYLPEERYIASFTLIAVVVYFGVFLFTSLENETRYWMPVALLFPPAISAFLRRRVTLDIARSMLTLFLALCVACSASITYLYFQRSDFTADLRDVAAQMTDMGYTEGYASYWHSNVLTELSNGQIEMWSMVSTTKNAETNHEGLILSNITDVDTDKMFMWMQVARHETEKPDRAFVLLARDELANTIAGQLYDSEAPIYENERFVVYEYNPAL